MGDYFDYDEVMKEFHHTCTYPKCWSRAEAIHHEPPKSLPGTAEQRYYPLCRRHHDLVQGMEREKAQDLLLRGARTVLNFYTSTANLFDS